MNVAAYSDDIVMISVTATQEHNLSNQLESLTQTLAKVYFEIVKHQDKDALKLVGLDVVQTTLDECM